MKENICTLIAVIGAIFTSLVGGWDSAMTTLVIFMMIDFMTGFVTAIIGKSKHSISGRLNSKAVWVGLSKKFCIILMVIVAMRIDILLETTYVRDATDDFYKYYGIARNSTALNEEEKSMILKGIDVSVHNGSINWNQVKNNGIQFAILRAGYGREASQKDQRFEEYYRNAKAVGMSVGSYWYSYAVSPDEAKIEAQVCLSILQGKQFEYPVYFDLEEQSAFNTGKANCSAMVRSFCGELERAGYFAGLYMSRSPFNSYMEDDIKTRYALWLAEYGSHLNYSGSVGMWQKSSTGRVSGINGNVDMNECYIDYAEKIKSAGLNGFSDCQIVDAPSVAPVAPALPKSENDATVEVSINGETYSGKLNRK